MGFRQVPSSRAPGPLPRAVDASMRKALVLDRPGQPLADRERHAFGARYGADFSRVRVHADGDAARQAAALGLKAFAAGEAIVFSAGRYSPGTPAGERLLAHELAHVTQQQRGGGDDAERAEHGARQAAGSATRGDAVSPQVLGGAPVGVYGDPDDGKATPEGPEKPPGSLLPPIPDFQLKTLPPIDWLSMNRSYASRGLRLGDRDAQGLSLGWQRGSALLDTLGIDDRFKLWFITKQWILNKGLSLQLENQLGRENPNSWDLQDKQWKDAHPGGWQTPIFPIFDIDWFRSKKKSRP